MDELAYNHESLFVYNGEEPIGRVKLPDESNMWPVHASVMDSEVFIYRINNRNDSVLRYEYPIWHQYAIDFYELEGLTNA